MLVKFLKKSCLPYFVDDPSMFKTDNYKEDYDDSLLQFVRPTMMSFIVVVTKKWSADALVRARENLALWSAAEVWTDQDLEMGK